MYLRHLSVSVIGVILLVVPLRSIGGRRRSGSALVLRREYRAHRVGGHDRQLDASTNAVGPAGSTRCLEQFDRHAVGGYDGCRTRTRPTGSSAGPACHRWDRCRVARAGWGARTALTHRGPGGRQNQNAARRGEAAGCPRSKRGSVVASPIRGWTGTPGSDASRGRCRSR